MSNDNNEQMSPAEMRKAAHEAKMTKQATSENSREEFRTYFAGLKRKLNLQPELEHVMWLHLQAIGMAQKDKFNEGTMHFGYKI